MTHSVIADQWDFEIRLSKEQRTQAKLKDYVTKIWKIIVDTETMIVEKYPEILSPNENDECYDDDESDPWHLDEPKLVKSSSAWRLPKQIHFITSEELHAEFPHLMDVHERETAAVRKYGAIFICGMGWPLRDGSPPEEVRSPSYDDWNLNGTLPYVVVSVVVYRCFCSGGCCCCVYVGRLLLSNFKNQRPPDHTTLTSNFPKQFSRFHRPDNLYSVLFFVLFFLLFRFP